VFIIANSGKKVRIDRNGNAAAIHLTRSFIPKAAKINQYAAAGLLTCFSSCGLPVI